MGAGEAPRKFPRILLEVFVAVALLASGWYGQTKLWMDRCLALPAYGNDPFAGKRIAIALTYGGQDPFDSGGVNALRTFQDAYRYTGSTLVGMVYGSATDAGEIRKNRALMKAAEDLGKDLVATTAPS